MKNSPRVQVLSWKDASHLIEAINPQLVKIINQLSPSDQFRLYKIRYYYGEEIIQHGQFHVPNTAGQLVPLKDASISPDLMHALNYNLATNPIGIVLNQSAELFVRIGEDVFPYQFLPPGKVLGAWGLLEPEKVQHPLGIWSMTAGGRSLFMVPKIANAVAHNRLCRDLGLQVELPKRPRDHWSAFRAIANTEPEEERWSMDLLFFSGEWFQQQADPAWHQLIGHLFKEAWGNANHLLSHSFWNIIFSVLQQQTEIPANAFLVNTVKHLFNVGGGNAIGYAPAVDETLAPVRLLQDVYVNGAYGLQHYVPTIMVPTYYSREQANLPVYFSQQHSAALEFSPKSNARPSLITDLSLLKSTFEKFQKGICHGGLDIKNTLIHTVATQVSYQFFHENPAEHLGDIFQNDLLGKKDSRFSETLCDTSNRIFAANGHLVRACVRVG